MATTPSILTAAIAQATNGLTGTAAPTASKGSVRVKELNSENSEYAAKKNVWKNLFILNSGGSDLVDAAEALLKKRPREDSEIYAARRESITYHNILSTGLGWYGASMFKDPPEVQLNDKKGSIKKVDEFYTKFFKDCNRNNLPYTNFIRSVFGDMLLYGCSWVLTDLPALPDGTGVPETRAQEIALGMTDSYLVKYCPLSVINWSVDRFGALQWAVIKTTTEKSEFLGDSLTVDTWYYFDTETFRVYEYERKSGTQPAENALASLTKEGRHCLAKQKRVPVRKIMLTDQLWIANRAYLLLLDHFNQDNTLKWSLFMANLAIPVIIGDVDVSNMSMSESGYLQFPQGTTYNWTEPAGTSFQHSAARLESLREEAFRSMHLQAQGRGMSATPAMQSGRSKVLEMMPATDVKIGMGSDLRLAMGLIMKDVSDAHGDDYEPEIKGFNFEQDMTTEEVFAVTSVVAMRIPSDTFERSLYKRVAQSWMPNADRSTMQKVYDEIEKGPLLADRLQKEMDQRVTLAKSGMSKALGKGSGPTMPPGRGGAGPSPN